MHHVDDSTTHGDGQGASVLTAWLLAIPALLALLLALAMPAWRLQWLALLLLAAGSMTLATPLLRPARYVRAYQRRIMGVPETTLLLLAVFCAALLLPLPAGLALLALTRLGLGLWRGGGLPGFPFMDGVLLLAVVLAMLPA